jgi:orotate phosphoribosyltransferase
MSLFQRKQITLHSGSQSDFKIECDDLTYSDVECLAYLISKKFKFSKVFGVPSGGVKIAECLNKYASGNATDPILIVDDVLTTGNSMEECKKTISAIGSNIIGVVLFARGTCPEWITPVFKLNI